MTASKKSLVSVSSFPLLQRPLQELDQEVVRETKVHLNQHKTLERREAASDHGQKKSAVSGLTISYYLVNLWPVFKH